MSFRSFHGVISCIASINAADVRSFYQSLCLAWRNQNIRIMDSPVEEMPTKNSQVLVIDDQPQQQTEQPEKPAGESIKKTFHMDCGRHLSLLLTGIPNPFPDESTQSPLEWFGMRSIQKENQPTRYQFYCVPPQHSWPDNYYLCYAFKTVNASALMRDVRKVLIGEHWLSKFVVTGPMKGKIDYSAYNAEEYYVRDAIYEALACERERAKEKILPFILNLHKQWIRENGCRRHLKSQS